MTRATNTADTAHLAGAAGAAGAAEASNTAGGASFPDAARVAQAASAWLGWTVRTFPERNATDMSAWYAVLCRPLRTGPGPLAAGALVQRTCVRLVARPESDRWLIESVPEWRDGPAPALRLDVTGPDGVVYRIEADWGARTVAVHST